MYCLCLFYSVTGSQTLLRNVGLEGEVSVLFFIFPETQFSREKKKKEVTCDFCDFMDASSLSCHLSFIQLL